MPSTQRVSSSKYASEPSGNVAAAYASRLLSSLGIQADLPVIAVEHPAVTWARSGLMSLTGRADGEPQMCPVPLTSCADGALAALASLAQPNVFGELRGSQLLAERAAIAGLSRAGAISPGGSCRLLEAADGWIALNLARADDWVLLPAWLEADVAPDWEPVERIVASRPVAELVERGRLLGLAVADDQAPSVKQAHWYSVISSSPRRRPGPSIEKAFFSLDSDLRRDDGKKEKRPLVVDLSSLWAGPLCSHLLQLCGARVIKVESQSRPDGARQGHSAFFDLLNARKERIAVDFTTQRGRDQLHVLLSKADIVIEASRPRALRQLGIYAEELITQNPGLSWISISGYGRGEAENWIAYGDDAGVAAGLSHLMHQATGQRMFVGDAIADPLTGLHAAFAAWSSWLAGGGRLISLSLVDVMRHCIQFDLPLTAEALRARQREWSERAGTVEPPRARTTAWQARTLGADTAAVLAEFGVAC